MDWKLEVVMLPVADVDRAKAFYENLGFDCDVDHQANEHFRVVQFTPPGSACSITFGVGLGSDAAPGSYRGTHLVVNDIEKAHAHLVERGVAVNGPYWFGENGQTPGLHPGREKFGTFCDFADPDGNTWIVQEVPAGT